LSNFILQRRHFNTALGLSALGWIAPDLHAQSRPDKVKVTIAVGGKASLYYLPLTLAEQLGYFKAEGLEVEIKDFVGGTDALTAVLDGAADVVSGAYEHTLNLQRLGQFFQAFVLQGRAPQMAMGVSVRNLPAYQSPTDLRGKKIGVTAPGSSTNMMANLVLTRAGLKAGEVSFIGVGNSVGALNALRLGHIDAISNVDPVMTQLEQKGEVRIIADTRTLKGTQEVFGGPMPAACLYAPIAFVRKYPSTVQALTDAVVHALKWLQTAGPSDLMKVIPESYLLGDRALYLTSFIKVREAMATDGRFPDEGAKTALNALGSFDQTLNVSKIDLSKTFTNEFAQKAKDRFKA
jgi:NitT/TauT family transport system substrate-binding protein